MKEIQRRCHVKIPVQFIQDDLLHSANFSWRTTTKAIPSQHLQYWNPLQKPRQKNKRENQSLEKSHQMLVPVLASGATRSKQRQGWEGAVQQCHGRKNRVTSSSSMVFAARKKQLIAIQFRYLGRACGTGEQRGLCVSVMQQ